MMSNITNLFDKQRRYYTRNSADSPGRECGKGIRIVLEKLDSAKHRRIFIRRSRKNTA